MVALTKTIFNQKSRHSIPKLSLLLRISRDHKSVFLDSHSAIKAFLSALFFLNSHFLTQNFFLMPPLLEQISSHDIGVAFWSTGIGAGSVNGAEGGVVCCGIESLLEK